MLARSHACLRYGVLVVSLGLSARPAAQGLGGAGTVQGTVKDPTGGVMQAVSGDGSATRSSDFTRTATTDATGRYVFSNLPPNPYHLTVEAQGFQTLERDVDVRSGVPITLDLTLALAGATSRRSKWSVTPKTCSSAIPPRTRTSIRRLIAKLPLESSAAG